jgi:coenzyme Q-binding protein COQ10
VIEHRETRLVPYPAELMYALSGRRKYPQFLPWVLALRVLSRRENGLTAEMAVGYGALRERYTSDVTLTPPPAHRRHQIKGPSRLWKSLAIHAAR